MENKNVHEPLPISRSACYLSDLEVFELLMLLRFGLFEDNNHCELARKYIDRFSNIAFLSHEF